MIKALFVLGVSKFNLNASMSSCGGFTELLWDEEHYGCDNKPFSKFIKSNKHDKKI